MIEALAIAGLELLAVVWACILLWVNAGLRRDIDDLRTELGRALVQVNAERTAAESRLRWGVRGGERPLSEGEIEPPPVAPPHRWPSE